MKRNNIILFILFILFISFNKTKATKFDYNWMIQQEDDESIISVIEILSMYIDEDSYKYIKSVDIPFFADGPLLVELKDDKEEHVYEIPYEYKLYDDLSEFNKHIFDYYNFNKKQCVSVIGFSNENKICIKNTKSNAFSYQDCFDGSFRVGNQNLMLHWDRYYSLESVPENYQRKIRFRLEGYEKKYVLNLLVDKRDAICPILLGIHIDFLGEKSKTEWEYVGPRKLRKLSSSLNDFNSDNILSLGLSEQNNQNLLNKSY